MSLCQSASTGVEYWTLKDNIDQHQNGIAWLGLKKAPFAELLDFKISISCCISCCLTRHSALHGASCVHTTWLQSLRSDSSEKLNCLAGEYGEGVSFTCLWPR